MEVFRYDTTSRYDEIKQNGFLAPNRFRRELVPIYALPQNPLIWGVDDTEELLFWIMQHRGLQKPTILMKWEIPILDTDAQIFVQESWAPE